MTKQQLTPQEAYTWLTKIMPNCRNDELEQIIAQDINLSWNYAFLVVKGRFELGEPAIANNGHLAYLYAVAIIKERFELAEPTIKKSVYWDNYCQYFRIKP
jgi:hypothetical protein